MEYQAVIFAGGKGSRYPEICTAKHKAMLPIGNVPMIAYPLHLLESAGFKEVLVIAHDDSVKELVAVSDNYGLSIKLSVVTIPQTHADDWGTADALRHVADRIKTNVILLSCDTITDVPLKKVVHAHRVHGAALTAVFSPTSSSISNVSVPGKKKKQQLEIDFVGTSKLKSSEDRLLFLSAAADFDETLDVRFALLKKFPHLLVQSDLMDAHIYVFSHWMIKYLASEKSLRSIKGEFIPHVLKKQSEVPVTADLCSDNKSDIFSYISINEMEKLIKTKSMYEDQCDDSIKCYSYITDGGICLRTNSLASYMEANRQIIKCWPYSDQSVPQVDPTAKVNTKQVCGETVIGAGVLVCDKVSIKNCIIGDNCTIQGKVQLMNSVIMSNVKVEEGCKVSGSIICEKATLEANVVIKDCIVGYNKSVNKSCSSEVVSDAEAFLMV